jgi:hypothetical protein
VVVLHRQKVGLARGEPLLGERTLALLGQWRLRHEL